jgi:four helix bundle protein
MIINIENLDVYKYSYQLAKDIYLFTKCFPKEETCGLVSQMRRSAVSICSNLSEGGSRLTKGEMKQFIGIARGSVAELKFQTILSCDLGFIDNEKSKMLINNIETIHKMLTGLIAKT